MTQDYKTKAREAFDKLKGGHSYEARISVLMAIETCEDSCKSVASKKFQDSIKEEAEKAMDYTTETSYRWLMENKVSDLTPAFCAGARGIEAIAYWFIKKDALILADEIDCELRGVEYVPQEPKLWINKGGKR